jgi:hypothetical protein
MIERFAMTGTPRVSATARRLFVGFALTLTGALTPISSLAAEDFFPLNPLFALPASLVGGETRVPAARPTIASPAHAHFVGGHRANEAPEGRLRLRRVAFRGMQPY